MDKRAETGYWVMRVPVISTAHLTAAVGKELHELLAGEEFYETPCMGGAHGSMIYCGDIENLPEETPQCVRDVLGWGKAAGFDWVRVDAAGDNIDGLPEYDW